MYKNFKLTEEEKKQIMEQHKMHGYKKPLKEDASMGGAPEEDMSTDGGQNYCGWEYQSKLGFDFNNDGGGDISSWWDKEVNGFSLHGVNDTDGVYFSLSIAREYTDKRPVPKNVIDSITSIVTSMGGKYSGMSARGTSTIFEFPNGKKSKNCKAYFDSCAKVVQYLKGVKMGKSLNEDQTGSLKGKTFDQYEQGALEERNFKINISNTQAVLNNPLPANIITVIKDVKSGGYTIIKGGTIEGYDTYKGGGKVLFTGPHDDCDVQLDKIIGYDSLRGGYAKKKMQEQGEPTTIPYPTMAMKPKPKPGKTPAPAVATNAAEKPAVPANKVDAKNSLYNDSTKHTQIDPTDPNFGKNIKQSDKLIGKKATLYANPEDAVMAYQAGKSNPQSPGSIIVQVNSIDYSDNNTLQIRITPDSAKTNYSTTNQVEIIVFNRVKGTFTIVGDTKVYYSESIKNILINDYFSTELASNNKAQQSNMSEEIDTDDEEAELSRLYNDEDEDLYDLDSDMKTGQFSSEFSDPDEWEDLHDFSVARNNIPKEKMVDMGRSGPKDIEYDRAQHFYNKIPGMYDPRPEPKEPTSDYYLRTYGTPDPDMESETLADKKKNAPINFPKYTDKDRRNPENMLSWEEKKKLMAQREEREFKSRMRKRMKWEMAMSRELENKRRGMNESIQLTESELVTLIKKIVNKAK